MRLAVLADTSLELARRRRDDGTAMSACDVPVITSDRNLAVSNFHGAMSMGMLRLPLAQHPPVLEGQLAQLGGLLLELINGTLVGAAALSRVNQVAYGGGLAGVSHVTDHQNDHVHVLLLLAHGSSAHGSS